MAAERIPEAIRRFFPLKATSLREFTTLVTGKGVKTVEAEPQPYRIPAGWGAPTTAVGRIGNYVYGTRFKAITPTGRKIIFDEKHTTQFGSERGFGDAEGRDRLALKSLITAADRLERIRKELPEIETDIISPRGKLDKQIYSKMLEDARRRNITPFDLPA